MRRHTFLKTLGTVATGVIVSLWLGAPRAAAQPADTNSDPNVETLTRGPVHEAFAAPGSYNPAEGIVVPKEPPPAIDEIPPAEKPEGDNVKWIPGYWSWDQDRNDFIWVSGIWRVPPPGSSWVPGYWTQVTGGWTWTPGFWMSSQTEEIQYLPKPPDSLEIGPSSPAPSSNYLWSPGCWVWTGFRYAWQPGYWAPARTDWVWIPSHYVWTPSGYVYVDGYWDWSLDRRGVLFAPVYWPHHTYRRSHFVFCPGIVIHTSFLTVSLFVAPRLHHYYFGDYYDTSYVRRGFHPWFTYNTRHRGYDPIFVHAQWQHERSDPLWVRSLRREYDNRRDHPDARPPRIYRGEMAVGVGVGAVGVGVGAVGVGVRGAIKGTRVLPIAAPLSEFAKRPGNSTRFEKIDSSRRNRITIEGRDLNKYRDERAKWEIRKDTPGRIVAPNFEYRNQRDSRTRTIELPKRPGTGNSPGFQPGHQWDIKASPGTVPQTGRDTGRPNEPTSERVRIPRSPVFGQNPGKPDQAGNPPGRPDIKKSEPSTRQRSLPWVGSKTEGIRGSKSSPSDQGRSDANRDNRGNSDNSDRSNDNSSSGKSDNSKDRGRRGSRSR